MQAAGLPLQATTAAPEHIAYTSLLTLLPAAQIQNVFDLKWISWSFDTAHSFITEGWITAAQHEGNCRYLLKEHQLHHLMET